MTSILKQRFIGAAILLFVLALIATLLSGHANKEVDKPVVVNETSSVFSDSGSLNTNVEVLQFEQEANVEPVYENVEEGSQLEPQQNRVATATEKESVSNVLAQVKPAELKEKPIQNELQVSVQEQPSTVTSPAPKPLQSKQQPVIAKVETNKKGWMIQLASFTQQNYARALLDKAKKNGYKAKIETVLKGEQKIFRVRIGPEYDRSKVDKLVIQLANDLKVSPQVLQYKP